MSKGFLVRGYRVGDSGGRVLWIAAADTLEGAIAAVEASMSDEERKSITEIGAVRHKVSAETVKRLGLDKGQVWRL